MLSVSELTIYPIKSARGVSLDSIKLNALGPECDRRWMVIDSNNTFVTQRKFPKMCMIATELIDGELYMAADGVGRCKVPAGSSNADSSKTYTSSVWGTDVEGKDCGDQAAQLVSELLGKDCRVIYMPDDYTRLVDTQFASQQEQVGFADGFPLLLTTQASLDDFNAKLSADTESKVNSEPGLKIGMDRFRPNIVITGNLAWAEDQWQRISIGGVELSLVKPCSRCIMPSIDPATSIKQMEVNQALLKHRRRDRKTYFGQNALSASLGKISLGDTVEILS